MLIGSICLSDIPRDQIKKVELKNGETKMYLNVAVVERKKPSALGQTHFISCAPKQEERKEGVNYYIGDLKDFKPVNKTPTAEEINKAPSVTEKDDLPF